jgi:hypothetical protein
VLGEFFRQKWPELVIMVLVAGIGVGTLDLRDRVAKLEEKTSGVVDRVDRIAQSLPSVRAQVAYEAVYAPMDSVLLLTKPTTIATGKVRVGAYLVDSKTGRIEAYAQDLDAGAADVCTIWEAQR